MHTSPWPLCLPTAPMPQELDHGMLHGAPAHAVGRGQHAVHHGEEADYRPGPHHKGQSPFTDRSARREGPPRIVATKTTTKATTIFSLMLTATKTGISHGTNSGRALAAVAARPAPGPHQTTLAPAAPPRMATTQWHRAEVRTSGAPRRTDAAPAGRPRRAPRRRSGHGIAVAGRALV